MIILKGSLSLASINKELRKLDMEPVATVSAPVKASVSDVISDQQPSGDAQPSAGAKSPAEVSSDHHRESSNWDTVLAVIITFSLTAVLCGIVFVWRGRGSCNPSKVTAHPVVQSVPPELPNPVEIRENDAEQNKTFVETRAIQMVVRRIYRSGWQAQDISRFGFGVPRPKQHSR